MRRDTPTAVGATAPTMEWGSDAIAATLSALELPYIALNPGASYRGLHDSIVNFLGNRDPAILLCLHEEHAVAIAHGYAKVTGRPMAVALHSNVGLMHATMAIFNAFCDRTPMVIIGATGPLDAAERRPWIDWIHTAGDQAALIRGYSKWDDQPGSPQAAVDALARANLVARTYPYGPTYVCLDARIQEQALASPVSLPDPSRHRPPIQAQPSGELVERVAYELVRAQRPLILLGRAARDLAVFHGRVRLAERLGAHVLTDLKVAGSFPSSHVLNPATPGIFLTQSGRDLLRQADLLLDLDWIDLAGTLRQAYGEDPIEARIISCSLDHVLHNGWSKDHFALPPVDVGIAGDPDALVASLLAMLAEDTGSRTGERHRPTAQAAPVPDRHGASDGTQLTVRALVGALRSALLGQQTCLVRIPLGWDGADLEITHPLDFLGFDGGGGIGSGPGIAVGAALALDGTGRLPVAVLGDGDYLMGVTALWTAGHHELPLLVIVANNRSFHNDQVHQEQVARARDRPVENGWLGQHIRDPDPDLAQLAEALGLIGHGPVSNADELAATLPLAIAQAVDGAAVVVDVRLSSYGYPTGPPASSRGIMSARQRSRSGPTEP